MGAGRFLIIILIISGCVGGEEQTEPKATEAPLKPQPQPSLPDATPPPAINGLAALDVYDGNVVLSWQQSAAEDFGSYSIYVSDSEIADVKGMNPFHKTESVTSTTFQVSGLRTDARQYFAVTAADKNGNEDTRVTSVSATSKAMPRGSIDPEIYVNVYRPEKAWPGTTLLPDNHNINRPRVIEVNMRGEIIWEYALPNNLRQYTNPGFDVEPLQNSNILLVLPGKGVYEINRNGEILWSYLDSKVSHDADRLPNGNTLVVFGNEDKISDPQVKEVNSKGEVVWTWHAKDHFNKAPYKDIYDEGWTHTNAVLRLPNGNTLISPRNFNFLVEVDPKGAVVRTVGEGFLEKQHDPEVLPNGNILLANHRKPHRAIEIHPETGEVLWRYTMSERSTWPVRDANRLPNGNTLITGTTKIVEVTPEGEVVWQLILKGITFERERAAGLGFYKAERIGPP